MSHSNGVIKAPVGIDSDIPQVLGISSTDLGTQCSNVHGKINKWSKKKPVRYANMGINLTLDTWWKSDNNANCGLNVNVNGDVLGSYKNNTAYEYEPPRGGDKEPYRALDFDGYDHNAQVFLRTSVAKGTQITVNYQEQQVWIFRVQYTKTSSNSIVLSDLDYALSHTVPKLKLTADIYYQDPITTSTPTVIKTLRSSAPIENLGFGTQIELQLSESDVGKIIYALIYLRDDIYPLSVPIPWDNNNYPIIALKVVNEMLIACQLNGIAYIGQYDWFSMASGVTPSNPFVVYSEYSNIVFKFDVTNKRQGNTNITKDYNFRIEVNGTTSNNVTKISYFETDFVKDINGENLTTDIVLSTNETRTVYIRAGYIFEDYVTETAKLIRTALQAKRSSENNWQTVSLRGLYVKKQ